ncbi:DUF4185 domain-containing protein [Actinopolymorpha sp. B9G3]|uniref:DUF4185 domain-containing protein n=1 Tax=Actinopolymorpha sp. B9G3 TaxID=3158970 RepID=UPI0032D96274
MNATDAWNLTPHSGRAWPEADRLFRTDPHWVGGDGSYSLQVGNDRVVWIFADTFISLAGKGRRESGDAVMINNSIGVQHGLDPTSARMTFHWRTSDDGRPSSVFADDGEGYFWPGNAVLLDDRLLIFQARVRTPKGTPEERANSLPVWGFEQYGWAALIVDNPYDEPDDWQIQFIGDDHLEPVHSRFATMIGFGAVWCDGDHVYAHAAARDVDRGQYLARWRVADAAAGRLRDLEWWCGTDDGWRTEPEVPGKPALTVAEPQSEFTVHRDEATGQLVWVQTNRLYGADIVLRHGQRPEGPWSEFATVFHPAEGDGDGGFVYGAKAHPELRGAGDDLVLTYNNNSERPTGLMDQPALYFPTFVRIPR